MKYLSILITMALFFTVSATAFAFASETTEGMKKDYAAFKKDANQKLEDLDRKIDQLKAESKDSVAKDVEAARDRLRLEVEQAQQTTATKWVQFKRGFAQSMDNLNAKVQKVLKE